MFGAGAADGVWDNLREIVGFFRDIVGFLQYFFSTKGVGQQPEVPSEEWGEQLENLLSNAWERAGCEPGIAGQPTKL
jgi:hypothetical protein